MRESVKHCDAWAAAYQVLKLKAGRVVNHGSCLALWDEDFQNDWF